MYEQFELNNDGVILAGYHFKVENAKYVVVLIHGIGEYAGRYERVANYFKEEKIAIVSMDLRGHGKTKGVRGHCAPRINVLSDIDCLINYAKELYKDIPVIVYGHSMGGGLVCDYKARGNENGNVNGYIISAPWLKLVKSFPKPLVKVLGVIARGLPELQISSSCNEEDLGNLDYVRPYKDDPLVHPNITLQTAYDGFMIGESIAEGKNIDNQRAYAVPTLVMHGSADKICDVNGSRMYMKTNENNPNIKYIEWEGYYHEIHNGGPNGLTGEEPIKKAIEFIKNI